MSITQQLQQIADHLPDYSKKDFSKLEKIVNVADEIGKAWSGSWLGYQSRVYYANFAPPPPGANFNTQFGLRDMYTMGSKGDWREFTFEGVTTLIYEESGDIDLDIYKKQADEAAKIFESVKSDSLSAIYANKSKLQSDDKFLEDLISKIEDMKIYHESDYVKVQMPSGKFMSSDMDAVSQGLKVPPHLAIISKIGALREPFNRCTELKKEIMKLISHINNIESREVRSDRIGTNIFIGHGRSHLWRELKDFVKDKLRLPYDEFNRVPVAGTTNIARLAQMLDQSCFAFLIMTAEDELNDGSLQARMNVIHEVGLFQGRLGFERAIVLLEDGCQEFTNINGLGQIRFQKGNISAIFEQIREVLEREEIV
ncbi:Predicted nucleotide-binding protein containing TIR-like domain [Serratia fonticola]|uniref:nucleotide-binding protein n=1 Tax=Serratia fonticola TaxID=47917 RepID=UPI002177CCDF|nr:nucleotide-binding protein [Serratia fonticola]CAI1543950.1 Predicted nucleotide-binding protein containing TIR-like domain [Serratia fonticola]